MYSSSSYESRQESRSSSGGRVQASASYEGSSAGGGGVSTTTTYRSAMGPRVTNVSSSRSRGMGFGVAGSSGVMTRIYQSQAMGGVGGFGGSNLASLAAGGGVPLRGGGGQTTALVGFNLTRQRDKRELVQLNDKFAQYVEKVRFLEAQNRKLMLELQALQGRSGHGSSRMKEMFDVEMAEARKLIDETRGDAAAAIAKTQQIELEVKRQRTRYTEVSGLRETDRKEIDSIEKRIAENEAQISLFRRRIADLEDEARRYKAESQRISGEIGKLQQEIQNERFLHSSCDVEKMALDDEIASLKQLHEADLAELRSQSVSQDLDPSLFFRNELAQAIREIRADYESVIEGQRSEMHSRYSLLYNELIIKQQRPEGNPIFNEQQRRSEERSRSELLQMQSQNGFLRAKNQEVKNHIEELRRKIESYRVEQSSHSARWSKQLEEARHRLELANRDYDEVSSLKTSLEKEITTYRELLESQTGLRGYVDRIVQNAELAILDRPAARVGVSSSSVSISGGSGSLVSAGSGMIGGGSTTISRTIISSGGGGSSYGFGGSATLAGLTGLSGLSGSSVTQSSASRQSSSYQASSGGVKSSYSYSSSDS